MKPPIDIDDILFKVLQQKTGENNVDQFVLEAVQQQFGTDKICYEVEKNNLESEFDTWLEEFFKD